MKIIIISIFGLIVYLVVIPMLVIKLLILIISGGWSIAGKIEDYILSKLIE